MVGIVQAANIQFQWQLSLFNSSRDFNPIYSWTEWNHVYRDMQKLYFVTLRKDVENPFKPESDEVEIEEPKPDTDEKNDTEDKKEETKDDNNISIDFDGIVDRIIDIPGDAGYYYSINCIDDNVYYCTGNSSEKGTKLKMYDLKKQKKMKSVNMEVI
ncbi:MAG: hypothetical protein R2750_03765 [Bacteroidales bacterium]